MPAVAHVVAGPAVAAGAHADPQALARARSRTARTTSASLAACTITSGKRAGVRAFQTAARRASS